MRPGCGFLRDELAREVLAQEEESYERPHQEVPGEIPQAGLDSVRHQGSSLPQPGNRWPSSYSAGLPAHAGHSLWPAAACPANRKVAGNGPYREA